MVIPAKKRKAFPKSPAFSGTLKPCGLGLKPGYRQGEKTVPVLPGTVPAHALRPSGALPPAVRQQDAGRNYTKKPPGLRPGSFMKQTA